MQTIHLTVVVVRADIVLGFCVKKWAINTFLLHLCGVPGAQCKRDYPQQQSFAVCCWWHQDLKHRRCIHLTVVRADVVLGLCVKNGATFLLCTYVATHKNTPRKTAAAGRLIVLYTHLQQP